MLDIRHEIADSFAADLGRKAGAKTDAIQQGQLGAMGIGRQSANAGRSGINEPGPRQQVAHRQRCPGHRAGVLPEELPESEQAL